MKKSYKILKQAINKAGVKTVATSLNVSESLIYKWCQNPSGIYSYKAPSGAVNPLDCIKKIYESTQDPELIHWICEMADGYFVENPPPKKSNYHEGVLKNIQRFIKKFSETLDAISESYNNEKRIDHTEAKRIRKEWEDLKSVGESFVRACEQGRYNRKPSSS